MPGHHSARASTVTSTEPTPSTPARTSRTRSMIRPIWVHSGLVTINSTWAVPPSRRRSLTRPISSKSTGTPVAMLHGSTTSRSASRSGTRGLPVVSAICFSVGIVVQQELADEVVELAGLLDVEQVPRLSQDDDPGIRDAAQRLVVAGETQLVLGAGYDERGVADPFVVDCVRLPEFPARRHGGWLQPGRRYRLPGAGGEARLDPALDVGIVLGPRRIVEVGSQYRPHGLGRPVVAEQPPPFFVVRNESAAAGDDQPADREPAVRPRGLPEQHGRPHRGTGEVGLLDRHRPEERAHVPDHPV